MFRNVLFTNNGTIAQASIDRLIAMITEIATDVTCCFVIPTDITSAARRKRADAGKPLPDRLQANEWISAISRAAATSKVRCKAYCIASDSPRQAVFAAAERYGCDAIAVASGDRDDITLLNLQI
jgi:hypothetical protein